MRLYLNRTRLGILLGVLVVLVASSALATEPDAPTGDTTDLHYLVPQMKEGATSISSGRRQFQRRLAFSPALGQLGAEDLFAMRLAFNPNEWLGYEVSLAHNPSSSLHAILHTFNLQLRYPLSGRFQPYASTGYGMITVHPGRAIQADPVTKNALAFGGGLEIYLRDDVALRGELRSTIVLGQYRGQDDTVAYTYREYTVGLVFYRSLGS